jgi:hypothetical protein
VLNNPIRFNDPTGHVCSDPDDLWSPSCDGGGGSPPNTPAPLPPAPVVITNPDPLDDGLKPKKPKAKPEEDIISPPPEEPDLFDVLWFYVNGMGILDLIEDGMLWGKPVYKQIKYALPLGAFEYVGDGILQLHVDRYKNLTTEQRMIRGFIRSGESAFIDALSFGVGSRTALALQAVVPIPYLSAGTGYVLGSYTTSVVLDNFVENIVNPYIFDNRFLGGP